MLTADRIRPLLRAAADTRVADDLEAHIRKLRAERAPLYLGLTDLDKILKWKLSGQYGRQARIRAENTEDIVRIITVAAFAIQHKDPEHEIDLKVSAWSTRRGRSEICDPRPRTIWRSCEATASGSTASASTINGGYASGGARNDERRRTLRSPTTTDRRNPASREAEKGREQ